MMNDSMLDRDQVEEPCLFLDEHKKFKPTVTLLKK